jgi:hypothetical protein
MNRFLTTTIGIVGSTAFFWAAAAIFVSDVGKLRHARESLDWPSVNGRVTRSVIDDSQHDQRPWVVYTYTVAGKKYVSSQISFDLFDRPGGWGRVKSIIGRYPAKQTVTVYYDPREPATAILEPGVYSPFITPLLFGAVLSLFGSLILWATIRNLVPREPVAERQQSERQQIIGTAFLSGLVYLCIVATTLDSGVQETSVKAFGERPAGMPNLLFIFGLQTLLYLPMPWVFWHSTRLTLQAVQDGGLASIGYLLTVARVHPHLRKSQMVCIAGVVYFIAVAVAWIIYAAANGV